MKETVYVIQMTSKEVFRHLAKRGWKLGDMSLNTKTLPIYGVKSKTEAVDECRGLNRSDHAGIIHYPKKIEIYT